MAAGAVVLLVLVLVWLAVRRVRRARAFDLAAVRTDGEITDIRWKTVGPRADRDRLGVPLVRFTLADGSVVETRSEVPVEGPHEVGDRVEVLYLPDAPARARVSRASQT
jgi:hypothetical protein